MEKEAEEDGGFVWVFKFVGLRDKSKRDSSAPQPGNFAGAKLGKKRRAALVGMTGLG
jgi:hypothetical protein